MVDSPFYTNKNPVDKVCFSLIKDTRSTPQYIIKILILDLMICVNLCLSVVKKHYPRNS